MNEKQSGGVLWNVGEQISSFTGRQREVKEIYRKVKSARQHSPPQGVCLVGLGGVGKSELALKFCHTFSLEYKNIFWINADCNAAIKSAFSQIKNYLQHPRDNIPPMKNKPNICAASRNSLFVFDNLENENTILSYLSTLPLKCDVLMTSKCRQWQHHLVYEVEPLTADDASQLIMNKLSEYYSENYSSKSWMLATRPSTDYRLRSSPQYINQSYLESITS